MNVVFNRHQDKFKVRGSRVRRREAPRKQNSVLFSGHPLGIFLKGGQLLMFPCDYTWRLAPHLATLEGQYISFIKRGHYVFIQATKRETGHWNSFATKY